MANLFYEFYFNGFGVVNVVTVGPADVDVTNHQFCCFEQ
jgi:hypothetical protein